MIIDRSSKRYRPEILAAARRQIEAGGFRSGIKSREAFDLHWDVVTLECGHETKVMHVRPGVIVHHLVPCEKCCYEWMDREEAKGK